MIAVFCRTNIEIVWRVYIPRLISTWRRVCLSSIYCSLIYFRYVRSSKIQNAFLSVIRPLEFSSSLLFLNTCSLAILVPEKDVYVPLIGLLHFCFERNIFQSFNTNHQKGGGWKLFFC